MMVSLNELAWRRCDNLAGAAERLNIAVLQSADGARVVDCGVEAAGGLEAGRLMAEVCLADLGGVAIQQGNIGDWAGPLVTIQTDQPMLACMASQYAGWQITAEKF